MVGRHVLSTGYVHVESKEGKVDMKTDDGAKNAQRRVGVGETQRERPFVKRKKMRGR